jgi:hypothetical protein
VSVHINIYAFSLYLSYTGTVHGQHSLSKNSENIGKHHSFVGMTRIGLRPATFCRAILFLFDFLFTECPYSIGVNWRDPISGIPVGMRTASQNLTRTCMDVVGVLWA